jgi:hypothetical protein
MIPTWSRESILLYNATVSGVAFLSTNGRTGAMDSVAGLGLQEKKKRVKKEKKNRFFILLFLVINEI